VKAAILFKFAPYVEWPTAAFATNDSPLVIGILGASQFGDDFTAIARDKTINNRPIVIKSLASITEATNCHVLFIGNSETGKLPQILAALGSAPVLTVGESDKFIEAKGMIGFVKLENKVRFEINNTVAKGTGLKISSRLLTLAVRTI
jgi:hypothetical protein